MQLQNHCSLVPISILLWIYFIIPTKMGAPSVPLPLYHLSVQACGAIIPAIANKQEAGGAASYRAISSIRNICTSRYSCHTEGALRAGGRQLSGS